MPQVIFFHLWGPDGPYDYSEGYFYTIGDTPPTENQKKYMSSGTHMKFAPREVILTTIRQHLTDALSNREDWSYATVYEITAEKDDYYFRFSGPPGGEFKEEPSIYKLGEELEFDPKSKGLNILQV
jgi:hypothetical protein